MPIYEYQCNTCTAVSDFVLMKHDEPFTPACKKCGSTDMKKLISRTRYLGGPQKGGLATNVEKKLLKSLGGNVSDKMRQEVKELANTAAKRGKKRFDKMMDTGKSDAEDY